MIYKYVSEEFEKRGKPKRFPIDLLEQGDILDRLVSPPLSGGLYHISGEVYEASGINESLREVKEAFCGFISKYLNEVQSTEWFVALFSNPVASCYVENTSKLRTSMVVLPEYKDFFDPFPTDNDWIGLPKGKADEKSKWLFSLAPSFSEHGSGAITTKIDPTKEMEGDISITPREDIHQLYHGPITYADLTNIPDLRARWYFYNIFYLRPDKIKDSDFTDSIIKLVEKEKKPLLVETKEDNLMVTKVNLAVPNELQNYISEYMIYVGGDPWTDDKKLWDYCKANGLVTMKIKALFSLCYL